MNRTSANGLRRHWAHGGCEAGAATGTSASPCRPVGCLRSAFRRRVRRRRHRGDCGLLLSPPYARVSALIRHKERRVDCCRRWSRRGRCGQRVMSWDRRNQWSHSLLFPPERLSICKSSFRDGRAKCSSGRSYFSAFCSPGRWATVGSGLLRFLRSELGTRNGRVVFWHGGP
jgi:hypothetical protein